jgi:hypothetical protein
MYREPLARHAGAAKFSFCRYKIDLLSKKNSDTNNSVNKNSCRRWTQNQPPTSKKVSFWFLEIDMEKVV